MFFINSQMKFNVKDAVPYLTFDVLDNIPFVKHCFSTRMGGVSTGEFRSMNMSFGRGDDNECVTENYRRLCAAVGIPYETLTASAQDHHTFVRRVTPEQRGIGIYRPKDMQSVDGLVTNDENVALVTYFADCTPLLFVDTNKRAVGAAHAGWRGTVGRIGAKTVERMTEEFGTDPRDLIVTIGPAIGKCCYEVDKPVADKFHRLGLDSRAFINEKENEKYMIDLAETNRQILMQAGVPEDNITKSGVCTKCSSDMIWSHRATGGRRGGMCAILCIV